VVAGDHRRGRRVETGSGPGAGQEDHAGQEDAAPVAVSRPVATPYALAAYSPKNQERILSQCPAASDVRGFHAWLKAGRVVRKGQKGIKIVAPVMGGDGNAKVVNIKARPRCHAAR
jgi:hypothetical protein